MSLDESDLIERLHEVARAFEMPASPPAADVRRGRRRVRRNRAVLAVGASAAVTAVVIASVLGWSHRPQPDALVPADQPGVGVAVPVWYDLNGLHHGDVVEQTPVPIWQLEAPQPNQGVAKGALALVRSGAVYLDPATGDVWFHPWGGRPHIVGRHSAAGPGGDPTGDTAAWFDGSELVVYDTAAGREISRTDEGGAAGATGGGGEHYPTGNGFMEVSVERITWSTSDLQTGPLLYSHDVRTGVTSRVVHPKDHYLVDVHDDVQALGGPGGLVLRVAGQAQERVLALGTHLRLSPTGNYVLTVESTDARFGPAIVDTRTGEVWRTPKTGYPWIAWSYGDVAVVDLGGHGLLACHAARRECEQLAPEGPVLLPTS